jgi:putative NIF3 family GTP cyclohydrolase 1 type 2
VALYVAHTNADVADPGVSDVLAATLGLDNVVPIDPRPGAAHLSGRGLGRIGRLPEPTTLAELTGLVARSLPRTAWGVRAAGDPHRLVRTVAVCGGSGGDLAQAAARAGADVLVTSDLKHHLASETVEETGIALVDAAHWATEWPWLGQAAGLLATTVETSVSTTCTDPWTVHEQKEP